MATLVVTQNKDGKDEIIYEGTGEIDFLESEAFCELVERDDVGFYMTYFEELNDLIGYSCYGNGIYFINSNHLNDSIKKFAIDDELLLHLVKGRGCWVVMDNDFKIVIWGPDENGKSFSQCFHEYEKVLTVNHNMTFKWGETTSLSEDTSDT